MTIRTKRRGRRSLAAILAAMLMASVLAVVAGTPAQAANTSGEYLIDHDEDADTAMVREFAGRDRYDTALKLATRFANDRGGIGTIPNAFVASGESLVDAVSVAGLAGFMDAPVLLTRSGTLHGGVADFIEDYGVSSIYVLGGTSAVSESVFDALGELAGVGSVERISGPTRYDTSAAIASNLAGESWCGTNENSAIIVNGADDSLFNAVAIGPVANRLELPVLLTAGDELVDAVISYIEAEDVEHAVIVGGKGSVSEGVEQALSDAGVDTVQRIDGDSSAAVSVAIAEVIGDECADDLSPVSSNAVALVNQNSLADGISAGPVLADDADQLGGGLIPILAVSDTLPASVRDYLAATPEELPNGDKIHMRVLAIGGTAAVSDSVVSAAVSAAASSDALSVQIFSTRVKDGQPLPLAPGDTQVVLKFSDDIFREATETETGLRNRLEDLLFINGVPADIASQVADSAETICQPDSVTVNLEGSVKAGDEVSIVASSVRVGASRDLRAVQPAEVTVPANPVDTQRPSIRIVAIVGHNEVYGLVSDNVALAQEGLMTNVLADTTTGDEFFEVTSGTANVTAVAMTGVDFTVDDDGTNRKSALLTFTLTDDGATPATEGTVTTSDRFRANRGAIEDAAGNESQVTTGVPVSAASRLQVSSVLMSNLNHTSQAVALIPSAHALADAPARRSTNPNAVSPAADDANANPAMWLQAKGDGAAAGAYGNLWSVRADKASNWDVNKDAEVQVFVSTKDRRIVLRVANGEPRFADVKAALEADPTVSSLFNVLVDNEYATIAGAQVDQCKSANPKIQHGLLPQIGDETLEAGDGDDTNALTGGITKARLAVNFNGWVETISTDQASRLLGNVLDDTLTRMQRVNAAATITEVLAALGTITVADAAPYGHTQAALALAEKTAATGPMRSVSFPIETDNAGALPTPRDLVVIGDGFRKLANGNPWDSDDSADGVQRSDTTAAVDTTNGIQAHTEQSIANGYGDVGGENDFNYGSRTRITTSSSVTAPN